MISARYGPAICVLVAVALVPTFIHSYSGPAGSDGLSTGAIPEALAGYTGRPSDRSATWGARRFDSRDWFERTYTATGDQVRLTVVRSDDAKSLYHHPELAVAYGPSFVGEETRRLKARADMPVHVLRYAEGGRGHAMYVLHYDGRFVDNAILFQARTSVELLFGRRKPMTLFFVLDESVPADEDLETSGAARVLFAAIDRFTNP